MVKNNIIWTLKEEQLKYVISMSSDPLEIGLAEKAFMARLQEKDLENDDLTPKKATYLAEEGVTEHIRSRAKVMIKSAKIQFLLSL